MKSVLWQRVLRQQLKQFGLPLQAGAVLVALLIASEQEARAYTDPGSGMLLWQMLAAAFVGVGFYFRKIVSWFKPAKKEDQHETK